MKKVLVINDDPDFQLLMSLYLTRQGYVARTINDDEAIFQQIDAYQPDLIVLDVQKERDNAICKGLREKDHTKDIRLVVLIEHELPVPFDCQPDAIIKKPFQPDQFISAIKELI